MAKYMNSRRRELVLWVCAIQQLLENNRKYARNRSETRWLDSTVLSTQVLLEEMMRGVDKGELRAVTNAAKTIQPVLYADKAIAAEDNITVSRERLYDLAEHAVELCRYDCGRDFANCKRRQAFLDLLIPPYSESGPCQYWPGRADEEVE